MRYEAASVPLVTWGGDSSRSRCPEGHLAVRTVDQLKRTKLPRGQSARVRHEASGGALTEQRDDHKPH
ncbi:hypothetical protein EYF80_017680 [Liparis tanakae]|uniref:Uncharacterized protein n=1 Tax=Liparis tanakae TaxID=230148 RepID=A0A4Z2I4E2_9TELE|nr:hypothetical protein EYF80_017680 [Liparis tanakae]